MRCQKLWQNNVTVGIAWSKALFVLPSPKHRMMILCSGYIRLVGVLIPIPQHLDARGCKHLQHWHCCSFLARNPLTRNLWALLELCCGSLWRLKRISGLLRPYAWQKQDSETYIWEHIYIFIYIFIYIYIHSNMAVSQNGGTPNLSF